MEQQLHIAHNIRTLRNKLGWTQAQLAHNLNLTESAVQKWETEVNQPPINELVKIADYFNLTMDGLLYCEFDENLYDHIEDIPASYFPDARKNGDKGNHEIYDAHLAKDAKLHRFKSLAGDDYSAIYYRGREELSCIRNHEAAMIDYWNNVRSKNV